MTFHWPLTRLKRASSEGKWTHSHFLQHLFFLILLREVIKYQHHDNVISPNFLQAMLKSPGAMPVIINEKKKRKEEENSSTK